MKIEAIKNRATKFNSVEVAERYVDSSPLNLAAFIGDDDLIWVLTGKACQVLDKAGYNRINF